MSKMNYRALMNDRDMMSDMVSGILKGIEKSNSKRLDQKRRKKMNEVKWSNTKLNNLKNHTDISSNQINKTPTETPLQIQVNIPEMIFQIPVPDELLSDDRIFGEEILITIPQDPNDHVNVMVPDAAIPVSSCKGVAEKTLSRLYKLGTGKELDKSKLEISEYCKLTNGWCSQCNDQIDDIPYICAKCKRGFCLEHKSEHDRCSENHPLDTIITHKSKDSKSEIKPKTKPISKRKEGWC